MGGSQSQQAYGQAVGTTPTNAIWVDTRDPSNDTDTNFPIGQFWLNKGEQRLFYLDSKSMVAGVLSAVWVVISIDTVLDTLSDDSNTVVNASSASDTPPYNIQIKGGSGITVTADPSDHSLTIDNTGNTEEFTTDTGGPVSGSSIAVTNTSILATGTLANAIRSNGTDATTIAYQTQYAGATATAAGASKWGVAQFDDNQFTVTSGFVQLQGGTTAPLLSLTPDAHTAPGTTPVLPTAGGTITIEGGLLFNTGTSAFAIRTNSLAANTIDLQLQRAGGNAASSTANNFGVAQFDTNSFGVTSGFVTLKNGGTTGAVTNIVGDDSVSTVPNGSGAVLFNGAVVNNATHAKPVYFKNSATSTETLDVQVTTTSTSGAKSVNKAGLASFDSVYFTVDASTGFISIASSTGLLQTLTGNSGGAISPTAGNINTLGAGSITIAGAGSTLTTQLTGLTDHAILVGAGTATITKIAATANTGAVLQNNSGADPSYSTATYPSTTTINQILYSSAANTVTGLATANRAVFTTTSAGVPVATALAADGQLIIGSTAGAPAAATLTAGTGISITNASNSITIAATGTGELQGLTVDSASGGTNPVVPNGSGIITLIGGALYDTGTHAFPIQVVSTAANTASLQIQKAGSNASSAATNNYGVSQFDSTFFNVSAGFVKSNAISLTAGTGITLSTTTLNLGGSLTISASATTFPWTDEASLFTAVVNNGYFITATLTATMPASPAQGDTVKFSVDSASGILTIQANTGQFIRLGNVVSGSAGTAVSTLRGDSIELVYRLSSTTWMAINSTGMWGIT